MYNNSTQNRILFWTWRQKEYWRILRSFISNQLAYILILIVILYCLHKYSPCSLVRWCKQYPHLSHFAQNVFNDVLLELITTSYLVFAHLVPVLQSPSGSPPKMQISHTVSVSSIWAHSLRAISPLAAISSICSLGSQHRNYVIFLSHQIQVPYPNC
jgi:hypothetical protein